MGGYGRYEAYQDLGIEWLGEIPAHWKLLPLKHAITFQRGHDLPADKRTEGDKLTII